GILAEPVRDQVTVDFPGLGRAAADRLEAHPLAAAGFPHQSREQVALTLARPAALARRALLQPPRLGRRLGELPLILGHDRRVISGHGFAVRHHVVAAAPAAGLPLAEHLTTAEDLAHSLAEPDALTPGGVFCGVLAQPGGDPAEAHALSGQAEDR